MSDDKTVRAPKEESASSAGKHPPLVWCYELGLVKGGKSIGSVELTPDIPCWQHAAADALHGWKLHEHHAGRPILLTKEDYQAALKAAEGPTYAPHKAALSPHAPWGKKV